MAEAEPAVTGRLLEGDIVDTPHGYGAVVHILTATDHLHRVGWHIVELTDGLRRPYRTDQLEFIARPLVAKQPNESCQMSATSPSIPTSKQGRAP